MIVSLLVVASLARYLCAVQRPPFLFGAGLALILLGCKEAPRPGDLALSNASPASSLLRLPKGGGPPTVYRLPRLIDADWLKTGEFPPLRRVIGADLDQRVVFAAGADDQIVALDLENGKVRTYLTGVRGTIIGPDGVLYTVDDSNHVTQIVRRTPARFSDRLPGRPRDMFGTLDDNLLAIVPGSPNELVILSRDEPLKRAAVPTGEAAASMWGDLVAIAADSVLVFYDPANNPAISSIRVPGHARAVVFSASGHRLYVARREGGLLELDRFTNKALDKIDLPGAAGALRPDQYGRWLLVNPVNTDSVWVVDLSTGKFVASFATRWSDDLPAVAGGSILLIKQENDVVAHDLLAPGHPESGRVKGGVTDLWLPIAWTPEGGTRVAHTDTMPVSAPDSEQSQRVFLQVSSSQNPDWAEDLAQKLREAGLPSTVLKPGYEGEAYRVVLGPYDSRETAEAEGRKLGRPFFIYQPDQQ